MIFIMFVGSNPSQSSSDYEAFAPGTRSRDILESWCKLADIDIVGYPVVGDIQNLPKHLVHLYNVSDVKTENNRPLKKSEIVAAIPTIQRAMQGMNRVIALGKTAHMALELAGIPHLELPHPSGMNRKLNNPTYVKECIDKLREYAK